MSCQGQHTGNWSSLESKLPRVRTRAGTGRGTEGRPRRSPRYDRSGNKWLYRLRSRPQGSNFDRTQRAIGLGEGKGVGERRAARGSRYRVRRWSSVAPRLGVCSSRALPPRATCSSLGHSRFLLPARRSLWDPLRPPDPGELLAGCNFRRTARSEEACPTRGTRGLGTSVLHPWARSLLRRSALGCRGTCSRAVHRVLFRAAAAAQVRDQLSLAPPPRAAPRQSPPPDAPRSPHRARAPPARARAPHPEPGTPFPVASPTAALTPAGRPDGKMPALAADAISLAAMAARGIPQGARGRLGGGGKTILGSVPELCLRVRDFAKGWDPTPASRLLRAEA